MTGPPTSAMWMWSSSAATAALATRDLAIILRTYRRLNGLNQQRLADVLGYDKTYVSMIETGRRTISDIGSLRHIAHMLGLPAHVFGVTDTDDADFAAMIQFGDSVIRLAELARRAGRTVDAVNELWPLVARLEARATEGHIEYDTLLLLARARAALGVSLGTILPEERLATAAQWTGKALRIAEHLDDTAFLAYALRMHGNELRKANRTPAAVTRLRRAVDLSTTRDDRGAALAFLARAAGEAGDRHTFDHAINQYRALLDTGDGSSMLLNPFTFREIHLRGLIGTGRIADAVRHARTETINTAPVAPQWYVIERVTIGQVHLAAGDQHAAAAALHTAIAAAETHHLPHQLQRGIRAAQAAKLAVVAADGLTALKRLATARGTGSPLHGSPGAYVHQRSRRSEV